MRPPDEFFIAGGTLRAQAACYVTRPADQELLERVQAGELCYILTSRQMGKSSLMVRTALRLRAAGAAAAIIDLTSIGSVPANEWYLGLLARLARELRLDLDPAAWWNSRPDRSPQDRLVECLRTVVLEQISGPLVVFLDEIDSTLNLPFRDDVFACIRAMYNARAEDPAFQRLTFVLLGVATPTDLIQNRELTPFNVGRRIMLQEFSQEEAAPLRDGLEAAHPGQGQAILARIFRWTSGHPYLTQKLCQVAAQLPPGSCDSERIDALVQEQFFSDEGRKDPNLKFVQDRVQASPAPLRRRMLRLYQAVHAGQRITDDDRSQVQNYLVLFGLLRVRDGLLQVRNAIYRRVFGQEWIEASMPRASARTIAIGASAVAALLVVLTLVLLLLRPTPDDAAAAACARTFNGSGDDSVRLEALDCLAALDAPKYSQQALDLFYSLPPDDQINLFDFPNPQQSGPALARVIRLVYPTLDPRHPDSTRLLAVMEKALQALQQPDLASVRNTLADWRAGRDWMARGDYPQAVLAYQRALTNAPGCYGLRYDKALALLHSGQYGQGLLELDSLLARLEAAVTPTAVEPPATALPADQALAATLALANPDAGLAAGGASPPPELLTAQAQRRATALSVPSPTAVPTVTPTASSAAAGAFRDREQIRRAVIATLAELIEQSSEFGDYWAESHALYANLDEAPELAIAPTKPAPTALAPEPTNLAVQSETSPIEPNGEDLVGDPPAIMRALTIPQWLDYVGRYDFGSVPPTRVVLHHTQIPNEANWQGIESITGIQRYYNTLGWNAAGHIYNGPDGIWLFTPMEQIGVHAGRGNSGNDNGVFWYSIGVYMVGDYDEQLPSGLIWEETKAVLGTLSLHLGIPPAELISLHRDYTDQKSCPGNAVTKEWVVAEVEAWIAAQQRANTTRPALQSQ